MDPESGMDEGDMGMRRMKLIKTMMSHHGKIKGVKNE